MTRERIPQAIVDLYDEYTHAPLDRRVFLDRLAKLAGGTAAAAALVPLIEANYAKAAMVMEDDARLTTERIAYEGGAGEVTAYQARPKDASGALPAVIVIHENRGLNAHIEDVARRAALEGYVAVAPDLLSSLGGTPDDQDVARDMIGKLEQPAVTADLKALVSYLQADGRSSGKVGVTGFCWGGGQVNSLAAAEPSLGAAVVYYGRPPAAEEIANIEAPLLIHLAGNDQRINGMYPAYEEALQKNGIAYQKHVYEGVNHAFNNDTSAERYDEAAAKQAWERTFAFFDQHLKA